MLFSTNKNKKQSHSYISQSGYVWWFIIYRREKFCKTQILLRNYKYEIFYIFTIHPESIFVLGFIEKGHGQILFTSPLLTYISYRKNCGTIFINCKTNIMEFLKLLCFMDSFVTELCYFVWIINLSDMGVNSPGLHGGELSQLTGLGLHKQARNWYFLIICFE